MPTARSSSERRSFMRGGLRLEEVAGGEVEEVLPRAVRAAVAERGQLGAQVRRPVALHPVRDLLLAPAGGAGEQVDHRVRVGGDEVHRPVHQALLGHRRAHRRPPVAGHARVAHRGAAEHPHAQVQPLRGDPLQPRREHLAPCLHELDPVVLHPAQRGRELGRPGPGRDRRAAHPQAQLVPLDLVGDERRDEVVEVGRRGQQHGHRAVAVVVPAAAPGGRLERRPVVERADAVASEDLGLLPHHDHAPAGDLVGQPADRVEERAEVELLRAGQRVQAGAHRAMRRLQHAQQRLAAGAQQRRVRAVVELDLVGDLLGRPLQRDVRGLRAGDAESGDGHRTRLY